MNYARQNKDWFGKYVTNDEHAPPWTAVPRKPVHRRIARDDPAHEHTDEGVPRGALAAPPAQRDTHRTEHDEDEDDHLCEDVPDDDAQTRVPQCHLARIPPLFFVAAAAAPGLLPAAPRSVEIM